MNSKTLAQSFLALSVAAFCSSFTLGLSAQVQTETSTTAGHSTTQTKVVRGEVVAVDGNNLIVKMADGSLRHITDVPESARATVDGKEIGIHDVKVGMVLQKAITSTTTPKVVTTVQTVTGKVFHVTPPASVILSLEDGTNQAFKIPKGQKFNIDGQMLDAWGLKKGMQVSATKIVEEPVTVYEQQAKIPGSMPPPSPAPPQNQPIPVEELGTPPPPAPVAAEAASAELPKTGSPLPLIGLLGLLSLGASMGLRTIRR
jgi:hypothetical protein